MEESTTVQVEEKPEEVAPAEEEKKEEVQEEIKEETKEEVKEEKEEEVVQEEIPEKKEEPVEEKKEPVRTQAEKKIIEDVVETTDDEEIIKFLEESKQKIVVIGAGGSGSNTLDRLFEMGISEVSLIAMNTDAKHLLKVRANKKIILGKQLTKGKGAGSNPKIGEEAAKESEAEIKHALKDADMVFVTCGLGGGTGTGSAPFITEHAKQAGALTVAVVTLPFMSEGKIRMDNALEGLEKLRKKADTVIVIKNDKLLTLAPDLPLDTAFKVCDEVLAGSVKGITELVTRAGLMNVDFADLRTILSDAGYAVIGLGEASLDAKTKDRARISVETALNSPLLDADISSSSKALINVVGGPDITLKEAEYVVSETAKKIHPNAHIIWGARLEDNMKKSAVRVLIVLAGVKFYKSKSPEEELDELDIDLIG